MYEKSLRDPSRDQPVMRAEAMQPIEEQRAVASALTDLASICADVSTEVRRLARRIAPAIPGGSPFDVLDKQAGSVQTSRAVPAPCRSHLTEELQSRIYQLRELASAISGMVERIEL